MFELILRHLLTIAGLALGLLLVASIQRQHNRPAVSIAWFLAILAIPWLAVPAFLLVGGRKLRKQALRKTELYRPMLRRPKGDPTMEDMIENVLMTAGMPSPRAGQRVEFLGTGEQAYTALMDLLEKAKHSINIMTFILGRDEVGRSLIDLLCRKAREGVQVRLLLDGLGCFLSSRVITDPLWKAGGKVGVFLPVLPLRRRWSANLRNHRKIVVVDGESAMIGGKTSPGNTWDRSPISSDGWIPPRSFGETSRVTCKRSSPAIGNSPRANRLNSSARRPLHRFLKGMKGLPRR
jgi:cardiolipin synthase